LGEETKERKMVNVKQQLASLANSSGASQKDRIEKYAISIMSFK